MPIHNFGSTTGQVNASVFDSVVSNRTDVQQVNTALALDNPDSADIATAKKLADEMINVSGANIQVYQRTENADVDEVWDEDPDPTYWQPIGMKAFFKPAPIEIELTKWGVDMASHKNEVIFSHAQLYSRFNERMLRPGDVLHLPYNAVAVNPSQFRITNATPSGNFRYIWLYYTCQVEALTADITVRTEKDMPVEEHIKSGGAYRESL